MSASPSSAQPDPVVLMDAVLRRAMIPTVAAVRDDIKVSHPDWALSIKKVRHLRNQGPANCAWVKAHVQLPQERDRLGSELLLGVILGAHGTYGLDMISRACGWPDLTPFAQFYDRWREVVHWYYDVYVDNSAQSGGLLQNQVMTALTGKAVFGDALIVKNGPVTSFYDISMDLALLLSSPMVMPQYSEMSAGQKKAYLAKLPTTDPYELAGSLSALPYDEALHKYMQRIPLRKRFMLAVVDEACCGHLDKLADRLTSLTIPADHNDLLARLPAELTFPVLHKMAFITLIRLSQTSKRNRALCAVVFHDRISTIIERFGLQYPGVRLMQTATETVLSGSIIPAVFHNGESLEPSDLDFYARYDRGWMVMEYLCHSGGYSIDNINYDYRSIPGLHRIWTLRRDELKLNVIESWTTSARDAVMQHHSTPVMGTLCASKGWLAYPRLSSASKALLTERSLRIEDTTESRSRARNVIHKYIARGFTFNSVHDAPHTCGVDLSCPATLAV
ncbi:hypothetical protein C8R44DRAFT_874498 [Mycena epipterygia]|nr:hypothetical protein C8R44DRAFT_874498 [Mycena epipterygia]